MVARRVENFVLSLLPMDIRQLRYFVALAEELHFHRAAARLHIAQPALSQQIRSLERELGLQLLERTNRRVSLTDAGARLLTEATAVVARFDEAVANMQRVRAGEVGTLRIGIFPGPLRQLLPGILAELRSRSPDIDVATRYLPALDQVTAVLEGRLDLALLPSLFASRHASAARREGDRPPATRHRRSRRRCTSKQAPPPTARPRRVPARLDGARDRPLRL